MEAALIFSLLLSQVSMAWLFWRSTKARSESEWKLLLMAESAMAHIKSKSLVEKAQVDESRRSFDAQMEYYRDTAAKDALIKKKSVKAPAGMQVQPRVNAITEDGQQALVDLSEFDILS